METGNSSLRAWTALRSSTHVAAGFLGGLFIGVTIGGTAAASPDSFIASILGIEPAPSPAFLEERAQLRERLTATEAALAEVLAEQAEELATEETMEVSDEPEEQQKKPAARTAASKSPRILAVVASDSPLPLLLQGQSGNGPVLATAFPGDLDAPKAPGATKARSPFRLVSDGDLAEVRQEEDEDRADAAKEAAGGGNQGSVYNTTIHQAPAAQNPVPQVVQGDGSSYQSITVSNIASVVLSALQNISTTNIVNLSQTCGDGCTLNADVDADAESNGGQNLDGDANANTDVNQESAMEGNGTTAIQNEESGG